MDTVIDLIKQNRLRHRHLEQYFAIIETAEKNKHSNPDICIESCKSLIEGISKTILINLDPTKTHDNIDDENLGALFKAAVKKLGEKSTDFEPDFAGRFGAVIQVLGEIRNKRGDISHGRAAPKQIYSSAQLAASMMQMTAGIILYLLEHYYRLPLSLGELDYASEDLEAYNVWLDEAIEDFPIDKARYSEILFEKDYAAYQSIYEDEYLPSQEDAEAEESAEDPEPEPLEPVEPREGIEILSSDFDEEAFWTPEAIAEVQDFAKSQDMDFEKLKTIINESLAFDKLPRAWDVFDTFTVRTRLKEWAMIKDEILIELIAMMDRLSGKLDSK